MPVSVIVRYTLSALAAAVIACAACLLLWRIRSQSRVTRRSALTLLAIGYMAALIQITALRIGLVTPSPFSGEINLIPGAPLGRAFSEGAWPFVYNVAGNLLWFVPLGASLRLLRPNAGWRRALLLGAAVSAAIESTQLALGTGMCDVDDVLLNALGCLIGWTLASWLTRYLKRA